MAICAKKERKLLNHLKRENLTTHSFVGKKKKKEKEQKNREQTYNRFAFLEREREREWDKKKQTK